jgi:hypothetical protein
MLNDIRENIAKAEKLKADLQNQFAKYNVAFHQSPEEDKTAAADVHNDMNKAMEMMKTGKIDEEFIKSIQTKYANKNS